MLLEELLMEENRVSKIENLSALVHLKKLDLGKNKIQRIEALDTLSSLVQLSLEDNEIESLAGLSKVSTLLELYLGNNKVADIREVLQVLSMSAVDVKGCAGGGDRCFVMYSRAFDCAWLLFACFLRWCWLWGPPSLGT